MKKVFFGPYSNLRYKKPGLGAKRADRAGCCCSREARHLAARALTGARAQIQALGVDTRREREFQACMCPEHRGTVGNVSLLCTSRAAARRRAITYPSAVVAGRGVEVAEVA